MAGRDRSGHIMKRIVVINQHGSNRGDEAACRAMIYGLQQEIPGCEIDLFVMYPLAIEDTDTVRLHPAIQLRGGTARRQILRAMRLLTRFWTGLGRTPEVSHLRRCLQAADLVISAPGGPYLGELYPYTEMEVMAHLFAALSLGKPVMIYAPSMGPFNIPWRNRLRRWLLRRMALITVREQRSADMLATSLGVAIPPEQVTCDSALQKPVEPCGPELQPYRERSEGAVGLIPLELERFDTEEKAEAYRSLLQQVIEWIVHDLNRSVAMFPQGYGAWRDDPLLQELKACSPDPSRVIVLPETMHSDHQQSLIGRLAGMISFRYHPGIFAVRQAVPSVVIAYEHKARGFMAAAGLTDACLDLSSVTLESIRDVLLHELAHAEERAATLSTRLDPLVERSRRTSVLAARLISGAR